MKSLFLRTASLNPFSRFDTFICLNYRSWSMKDIVGSKKMENGIVVFFMEKEEKKYESFNYAELVDMKINALDLLDRPKSYKVDVAGHKLIVKK
jgi:hypothetical protein